MAKTETVKDVKSPAISTANFDSAIDFSTGKSAEDLAAEQAQSRGMWPPKLQALLDGVTAGKGEVGTFYRLGVFSNASGARTVIREFERNPGKLPASFDMEARVVARDGKRTSELWVAVPADDEAPEG